MISTLVVSLLSLLFGSLVGLLMQEMKDTAAFNIRIGYILNDIQQQIIHYLPGYLPVSIEELQHELLQWVQAHIVMLQNMGKKLPTWICDDVDWYGAWGNCLAL